jgi:hypothetical protein
MRILAIIGMTLCSLTLRAEEFARVAADLKIYDERVAVREAEFSKLQADLHDRTWVKAKLQHMADVDQYMRKYASTPSTNAYTEAERLEFDSRFMASRWAKVDAQNTEDLKALLVIHKWFNISVFGPEADNNAWLLVQHADLDPSFQKRILAILEPLVARQETNPRNFAYLFDRVASSFQNPEKRTAQRYGTQGRCIGKGQWEPFEVEDPANLDKRRASVGLSPEEEYKKLFKDLCLEGQKS